MGHGRTLNSRILKLHERFVCIIYNNKHLFSIQKQSPEGLLLKRYSRSATLFKKYRLPHRCFPVNFAKFRGTLVFIEHLWWLVPSIQTSASFKQFAYSCYKRVCYLNP